MIKVSAGGGSMKSKWIKSLIPRLLRRRTTFPKFVLWIYRRQNEMKYKTFWWPLSDNSSCKHCTRKGKYIELHANIISPCVQWQILAASFTGEQVKVTILGTKFGQSNEGGGSTGEGEGGWFGKEREDSFTPPPPHFPLDQQHPPPPFPRPKPVPQALIED